MRLIEAGTPVRVKRIGERDWRPHTTRTRLVFTRCQGGTGRAGETIVRQGHWLIMVLSRDVRFVREGEARIDQPALPILF